MSSRSAQLQATAPCANMHGPFHPSSLLTRGLNVLHTDVVCASSRASAMPPPPPRPKTKEPGALDEDTFVEALGEIIERDFFPDLPKLQRQLKWLEGLESRNVPSVTEVRRRRSWGWCGGGLGCLLMGHADACRGFVRPLVARSGAWSCRSSVGSGSSRPRWLVWRQEGPRHCQGARRWWEVLEGGHPLRVRVSRRRRRSPAWCRPTSRSTSSWYA